MKEDSSTLGPQNERRPGLFWENWINEKGHPAGGVASGCGFTLSWQNGPLGRGSDRKQPNGAFVEDVLDVVIARIEFYQTTEFACEENEQALNYLREAAEALELRTRQREARGVEGTHQV